MISKKTKAGTIVQVRQTPDLILSAYADYTETDLLIEKANLNEIIRTKKFANLEKYQNRLAVVESFLALQAA